MKRCSIRTMGLLATLFLGACGPTTENRAAITTTVSPASAVTPFSTATGNSDAYCWPGAVCIYNIDFNASDATTAGVHWNGVFMAIDDQGDIGASPYFEYNMRYGLRGDEPNWQQLNFGSDVHDVALHNLQPNSLYGVIVEGHEGEGSSQWSPWSTEVLFETASRGGTVAVRGTGFPSGAALQVALQAVPDGQGTLRSIGPFAATADGSGAFTDDIRYGVCLPSVDISQTKTTITAVEQKNFTGASDVKAMALFCDSPSQVPDVFASP